MSQRSARWNAGSTAFCASPLKGPPKVGLAGSDAQKIWRDLMETYRAGVHFPGHDTVVERAYNRGEAVGEARALLMVMNTRGIPTTPELEEKVHDTRDLDVLSRWINRAATATTAEQVFEDDEQA